MAAATDPGDDGGIGEGPVPEMASAARDSAEALLDADSVLVVTDNDADGIASAAIATRALKRAGVSHELSISEQLNEERIDNIAEYAAGESDDLEIHRASGAPDEEHDAVLFVDFGSGQRQRITDAAESFTPVIADHHQPSGDEDETYVEHHLNPLLEGIDGASELSGAGTIYVLARQLAGLSGTNADRDSSLYGPQQTNKDLAKQAVIGAVADRQGGPIGLNGANRELLREGEEAGVLESVEDLNAYGKQTYPLPKMLSYVDTRKLPGIARDRSTAEEFLRAVAGDAVDADDNRGLEYLTASPDDSEHDDLTAAEERLLAFDGSFDLRESTDEEEGTWKTWVDLEPGTREELADLIESVALVNGASEQAVDELVGENYLLAGELEGTTARDPDELATDLNSAKRFDEDKYDLDLSTPPVKAGLDVALGDRNPHDSWGVIKKIRDARGQKLRIGIEAVEKAFQNTHEKHWDTANRGQTRSDSVPDDIEEELDDVIEDYQERVITARTNLKARIVEERSDPMKVDEKFEAHKESMEAKIEGLSGALESVFDPAEDEESLVDHLDEDRGLEAAIQEEFRTHREYVINELEGLKDAIDATERSAIQEAFEEYREAIREGVEAAENQTEELVTGDGQTDGTDDEVERYRVGGITVGRTENAHWFEITGGWERHEIPSQEVGVIAGILRKNLMNDSDVDVTGPMIGFAHKGDERDEESELKVSTRGDESLVDEGLDLSTVVSEAAEAVGGKGGGHDAAAGASLPAEQRDVFLRCADTIVGEQLENGESQAREGGH